MRKPASTIAKFSDGGEKKYNQKPHLAPGVPRNKLTTQGYTAPGETVKKTRGSGGGVYDTETTAGAGIGAAHGGYSAT